jgi:protocatechuate 3,4-dioxygenase beta subunit
VTDAAGAVRFASIFPGWYPGRTVHVHVRVRAFDGAATTFDFATQLFFDDAVSDRILARPPYDARGPRDTTNAEEGIYDAATRTTLASDGADGAGSAPSPSR